MRRRIGDCKKKQSFWVIPYLKTCLFVRDPFPKVASHQGLLGGKTVLVAKDSRKDCLQSVQSTPSLQSAKQTILFCVFFLKGGALHLIRRKDVSLVSSKKGKKSPFLSKGVECV